MKVCPRCQKTYSDDNLNFCLDDGSVLTQAGSASAPPPETVLINQPRTTGQNQPGTGQPGGQGAWGSAPQQYSMQPKAKSSKTWIWVVLILGLVAVVCGGGLVGFFAYVASQDPGNTTTKNTPDPRSTPTPAPSPSTGGRDEIKPIDMALWAEEKSDDAYTEYSNSELTMAAKEKGYYYVMVAKSAFYEQGDVSVTVRNVNDEDSRLGYGLVIHSLSTPLIKDYCFLIDAKKKRYRIVKHSISKETATVAWKDYPKMKGGTEANVLEAKDSGDQISFYINSELVTTVKNDYGTGTGVPGIYSGDGVKAAFSKLELRK